MPSRDDVAAVEFRQQQGQHVGLPASESLQAASCCCTTGRGAHNQQDHVWR